VKVCTSKFRLMVNAICHTLRVTKSHVSN